MEELKEQPEQEGLISLWCLSAVNKILTKVFRNKGEECDSKRDLEEAEVSNKQGDFVWVVKSRSVGRNELRRYVSTGEDSHSESGRYQCNMFPLYAMNIFLSLG